MALPIVPILKALSAIPWKRKKWKRRAIRAIDSEAFLYALIRQLLDKKERSHPGPVWAVEMSDQFVGILERKAEELEEERSGKS